MVDGEALTLKQVAARLSVSEKTVRRMIRDGKFPPPFPVGRAHRWWARDVESYLWMQSRLHVHQPTAPSPEDDEDEEG